MPSNILICIILENKSPSSKEKKFAVLIDVREFLSFAGNCCPSGTNVWCIKQSNNTGIHFIVSDNWK